MTELLVAAGDFLGDAKDYAAGSGCYVRNGAVYASLIGRRSIANVGVRFAAFDSFAFVCDSSSFAFSTLEQKNVVCCVCEQ
jgi:exosome complex RNA-binding protein Rrp4